MGRQHSSGGSSHWEPAIVMVQQWIYLHKTEQHHCNRNSLKEREKKILIMYITPLYSKVIM